MTAPDVSARSVLAGVVALTVIAAMAFTVGHYLPDRPAGPIMVLPDTPTVTVSTKPLGVAIDPELRDVLDRFIVAWTTPGPLDARRGALVPLADRPEWADWCAEDNPDELPHGGLLAVTDQTTQPGDAGEPEQLELDVITADSTRLQVAVVHRNDRWLVADVHGVIGQC